MTSKLLDFSRFENNDSKFTAELQRHGGNITFSNSGKRGNTKYFSLSLISFLNCLKDIKKNLNSFQGHENYVEQEWRNLGSKFFTDGPANAQITVQTKPMFVTLSKIIMWANSGKLNDIDPEVNINLELSYIEKAISSLEELIEKLTPTEFLNTEETSIINEFIKWFVELEGVSHNYLRDSFSNSIDK